MAATRFLTQAAQKWQNFIAPYPGSGRCRADKIKRPYGPYGGAAAACKAFTLHFVVLFANIAQTAASPDFRRIGSRCNLRYFQGDILNGFASLSFLEYRPNFFEIGLKAGQAFAIFRL